MPTAAPDWAQETVPDWAAPAALATGGTPATPDWAKPQPLTPEFMASAGDAMAKDEAQRQAIARGMESGTEFVSTVANDPIGAVQAVPQIALGALTAPGKLAYYAAADVVSQLPTSQRTDTGDVVTSRGIMGQFGGNLEALKRGETLPVEKFLNQVAVTNPKMAVGGKLGRDLSAMSGLGVIGALPAGLAKLAAAGFTVDMIAHAPEQFQQYAEEINKPPAEQDAGKISDLRSGILQTFTFAPLAGGHVVKPGGLAVELSRMLDNAEKNTRFVNNLDAAAIDALDPNVSASWQANRMPEAVVPDAAVIGMAGLKQARDLRNAAIRAGMVEGTRAELINMRDEDLSALMRERNQLVINGADLSHPRVVQLDRAIADHIEQNIKLAGVEMAAKPKEVTDNGARATATTQERQGQGRTGLLTKPPTEIESPGVSQSDVARTAEAEAAPATTKPTENVPAGAVPAQAIVPPEQSVLPPKRGRASVPRRQPKAEQHLRPTTETPSASNETRAAAKEFDRLLIEHGLDAGWVKHPELFYDTTIDSVGGHGTASIKAKIAKSKEMQAVRERAAFELDKDLAKNISKPEVRAQLLDKLKAKLEPQLQMQRFAKATATGKLPLNVTDLKVGDTLTIEGEQVRVKEVTPDGDVVLEDGKKFGTQLLSDGTTLFVEDYQLLDVPVEFAAVDTGKELPKVRGEGGREGWSKLADQGWQPQAIHPSYDAAHLPAADYLNALALPELAGWSKKRIDWQPGGNGGRGRAEGFATHPDGIYSMSIYFDDAAKPSAELLTHRKTPQGMSWEIPRNPFDGLPSEVAAEAQRRTDYIKSQEAKQAGPPKLRAGEKGTGDLLQGQDAPFNLAGERGVDFERVAREKAKAEEVRRANEEFQAKNQQLLPGTSGIGFPMGAPVPAIPPPAPAPGVTMIQHGRLPVTLDRTGPGSVSVPQIMDAMQRILKVAGSEAGLIRTGRFLQKALGIWKPHEEIIRMESADSIPTATHEVGHGLQQMIYGTAKSSGLKFLSPAIRKELIGMGKALYGGRKPAAGYTGEGFAEFARYWLTTNDAARVAPNLTKFFEQTFLPAHPDVARALYDARATVDIWRRQGSVERANRQVMREPGAARKLLQALAKAVGYQAQFESGAPIEAISKAAARKLGRSLSPSEDPFKLYSWKRGSAGATVERMATEHMLDVWGNPVGPSLAEVLAPVKGRRKEFLLYVFAQAAEMRWKQGKNPGISLEDAQHIKGLYNSPETAVAADGYRKWMDGLLDYAVQADPSMADAVARMRGANDYYAPLARMIDPAKAKAAAASAQSNSMQRMFGSGLPVKDIFDQTFINAARLVNRANRALVTRAIVKLSNVPGLGHIVEEVPRDRVREQINVEQIRKQLDDMGVNTAMIPQDQLLEYYSLADRPKGADPIVSVKDAAGQTHWYQVDPRLYDTLEGLQTYSLKQSFPGVPYLGQMLDLVLGVPSRAFRLGTTGLRPAFSLVTNPTRDLATLLAQTSSNPAKVAALYPGALAEAIRGGPYKSAFYDLGAHLGQPLGTDIGHTQRVSKELFHGRIMRVVRNPVDHLRELLSITESAPRIAELKAVADDLGWKPGTPLSPDQAVQLALAAKRVTVDFSAAGDLSRILNQAIPFYNPSLQGARSFARAFKNNPGKATLMGLALFTGPALALWWQNKDKEWYQSLPWRERYLYTHIDDGNRIWRIPRPFEWGNAFMVIPEAIMDSFYRHDPTAARQALTHIFESTNPADLPVLGKLAKEQWQNRIDFWDRPIVPRGETDLPASEQVGPYTSQAAIAINRAFPDLSPRRVDAAVRGYFGGLGTDVMDLLGIGAQRQERDWEASDFPVFGTLFRRGGEFNAQNQHINDFWEAYLPSKARLDGFNYGRTQVEKGLRAPDTLKPPTSGDTATVMIGTQAAPAIKLLLQMAARTRETRARSELYRQAGEIARDAAVAMRNAQNAK